jgi:hypothetical protein
MAGKGASGFRDFPDLSVTKENRNDSRWTLPAIDFGRQVPQCPEETGNRELGCIRAGLNRPSREDFLP